MRTTTLETNNFGTALRTALQELGFDDCYHMMSASVENPPDCLMWSDALASKYDGKGKFGREQWDQLLGHCQAVCDWPAVAFAKELIEAYPDAKVLVTTRDIDSWHASTMKTVHWRATEPELKAVGKFDWAAGMYQPMLDSTFYPTLHLQVRKLANRSFPQNSGPSSGKATLRRTASVASTNTTPRSAPSCPQRTCSSTRWARVGSHCAISSRSPYLKARSSLAQTTPTVSSTAAAGATACKCSTSLSALLLSVAVLRPSSSAPP